jgi:hypothetical protein
MFACRFSLFFSKVEVEVLRAFPDEALLNL